VLIDRVTEVGEKNLNLGAGVMPSRPIATGARHAQRAGRLCDRAQRGGELDGV